MDTEVTNEPQNDEINFYSMFEEYSDRFTREQLHEMATAVVQAMVSTPVGPGTPPPTNLVLYRLNYVCHGDPDLQGYYLSASDFAKGLADGARKSKPMVGGCDDIKITFRCIDSDSKQYKDSICLDGDMEVFQQCILNTIVHYDRVSTSNGDNRIDIKYRSAYAYLPMELSYYRFNLTYKKWAPSLPACIFRSLFHKRQNANFYSNFLKKNTTMIHVIENTLEVNNCLGVDQFAGVESRHNSVAPVKHHHYLYLTLEDFLVQSEQSINTQLQQLREHSPGSPKFIFLTIRTSTCPSIKFTIRIGDSPPFSEVRKITEESVRDGNWFDIMWSTSERFGWPTVKANYALIK